MAVYWVGADGNVYVKGNAGVQNAGKALKTSDNGFDAANSSGQATRIADPNPPRQSTPAPSNPNNTGGGTSATPAKPDKSNDIALNNAGLSSVDAQTAAGLSAIEKALGGLVGTYDTEANRNEQNYVGQSTTNQGNLQTNKQTALVNAAQGRQGLFGTLSSLGALNGSGIDLANQAVQKGANDDLAGASENYSTNQQGLDTAIGTFRDEDKQRRQEAQTAAENAKTNTQNNAAKNKMSFLTNLSNDYADMGDSGNAQRYSSMAAALYPQVAATSVPDSNLSYSGAAYTPSTLANYMAGANSTQVNASPTNGAQSIPGLIASTKKKQQTASAIV